jgi:hypothetical protein
MTVPMGDFIESLLILGLRDIEVIYLTHVQRALAKWPFIRFRIFYGVLRPVLQMRKKGWRRFEAILIGQFLPMRILFCSRTSICRYMRTVTLVLFA